MVLSFLWHLLELTGCIWVCYICLWWICFRENLIDLRTRLFCPLPPWLQTNHTSSSPSVVWSTDNLLMVAIDVGVYWVQWGIQLSAGLSDGLCPVSSVQGDTMGWCLYGPQQWGMTFLFSLFHILPQGNLQRIFPSFIVTVFDRVPSIIREMVWIGGLNNPQTALGFKMMIPVLLVAC